MRRAHKGNSGRERHKSKAQEKREEEAKELAFLRRLLRPGTVVYTTVGHVSRSGMARTIEVSAIKENEPLRLTYSVATVLGYPMKDDGFLVRGCGMDMGYHVAMSLSYALHGHDSKGDGAKPENQGRIFEPRPGHFCAGYSLKHRWL